MHTGMVLELDGMVFWRGAQRRREGSHVASLKRICGLAYFIFKKSDRPLLAWISFGAKLCRCLIVINGVVRKQLFLIHVSSQSVSLPNPVQQFFFS